MDTEEWDKAIAEALKQNQKELAKNLYTPLSVYASVHIDTASLTTTKKKPWWLKYKYRIKDAWAVLVGKKGAYTDEDIDNLGGY